MERLKTFLVYIRNGLSFGFTWLAILVIAGMAAYGRETVEVGLLFKLLIMCLYGAVCFSVSFTDFLIRKKGFIFRLTVMFLTFVPGEIFMFYRMGLFGGHGTVGEWTVLLAIVVSFYIICLILDRTVFKARGERYTKLLNEYNRRHGDE